MVDIFYMVLFYVIIVGINVIIEFVVMFLVKKCVVFDKLDICLVFLFGYWLFFVNWVVVVGVFFGVFFWIKMKIIENIDFWFLFVVWNGGNYRIFGDVVRVSLD